MQQLKREISIYGILCGLALAAGRGAMLLFTGISSGSSPQQARPESQPALVIATGEREESPLLLENGAQKAAVLLRG